MRVLLAMWRMARVLVHLGHGMILMALRFERMTVQQRHAMVQWWSRKLLAVVGLSLTVNGQARQAGGLLIANHVSWLDIAVLHAACPQARFVSKADVRKWPLLGWLIAGVGTLFIERERKRDAMRMVHDMAAALQRGETVAVFPEGTTGAGAQTLPFHANLLQAAIAVEAPIIPAALRYSEPGHAFAWSAQYIDDTTLVQSIWRVVSARGLAVELTILPPHGSAHADRRALAAHMQAQIQQVLDAAPSSSSA
ncbi:lysophospholipid acyltransferase family protein [Ideonella margarita]|uniref:Lysophospholipid acyltransferase family protein n=1 Tax=Ideonella margarita TaxID=2984191 RepID=A0ABU9C3W8_9BURK